MSARTAAAPRASKSSRTYAPALDAATVLEELYVPEPEQWISSTSSRLAGDGYGWMQAVHWIAGSGLFTPRRTHGPKFGSTTVAVARELARLSPCRPGVAYLARKLNLGERTVQYHLEMLRQAGLLTYVVKGTRRRQARPLASEFARVIPGQYDAALGIRTVGEGVKRRACGIAEEGRKLVGRLGRKARGCLKSRRRTQHSHRARSNSGVSSSPRRCTPITGGSPPPSSAATTWVSPSESKLASGKRISPTVQHHTGTTPTRKLNAVGRRFQLARQLITEVDWLDRASVPRIAWIVQDVADAGWTVTEVRAWLHLRGPEPVAGQALRPSGLLATMLRSATRTLDTRHKRREVVEDWRESRRAERARHANSTWDAGWDAPRTGAVRRLVDGTLRACFSRTVLEEQPAAPSVDAPSEAVKVSDAELAEMRQAAWGEYQSGQPRMVEAALALLTQTEVEDLYGRDLVARVQHLSAPSPHLKVRVIA